MTLREDGERLRGGLVRLRRELHQEPEIGLHLPATQARVLDALDGLPLEVATGDRLSSVTAVLRGDRPGPVVLLRGDMDALPVTELTGLPYASRVDGVMHACGHDLRMEHPDPGSEDFSRVLQRVPGAFLFLGAATTGDHTGLPDNHSPRATFDDGVLVDGAVLLAELALRHNAPAATPTTAATTATAAATATATATAAATGVVTG
jgi:hippurate hydrolase